MTRPRRSSRAKAGYSVLEMLIVLAIMALCMAIVLPRGSVLMDRTMAHVVFFELQRDVSALRREAYRTERPVTVAADAASAKDGSIALGLRPGWRYRLDQPLVISSGGACSRSVAEILRDDDVIMHLATDDGACRFIRRD